MTILRRLKERNIFCYKVYKKPFLCERNKIKRCEWGDKFKQKNMKFWKNIVWSDEAPFSLNTNDGKHHVYREPHENPYQEIFLKTKVNKSHDCSVQVWGCIMYGKIGPLVNYEGRLTGDRYEEILKNHLFPWISKSHIFQDDNAPSHSKNNHHKKLFTKHNIVHLPWPSNSPDLNPIENVWSYLGVKLLQHKNHIHSKKDLFKYLLEEWKKLDINVVNRMIGSMRQRIKKLIDEKGGHIKY